MSSHPSRDGWFRADGSCEPIPPQRDHIYRLVLLGPPGVGKGTQAALLSDRLRACHLSTGDLFRSASCETNPSPAMVAALETMRRGELVSDDLVMAMVRERNGCLRCRGGFLLDGIPRTLRQAEVLQELLDELDVSLDAVISYELPLEEVVDRIGGRRTCSSCKAVFHLTARPPRQAGICDRCNSELVQRDDDRPDAVRVRMQAYDASTRPLIEHYQQDNKLVPITASGSPEEICDRTLQALEAMTGVLGT